MKKIIKKGDKYNLLTAIRFDHKDNRNRQFWLFKCDCGNKKVIREDSVKGNKTKSCGCLGRKIHTTHGMSYTREHNIWNHMKQRCLNENDKNYKDYGARGIKVCKRWLKFENFYKDMGKAPINKSIDRINNNGNYEPDNCRWATMKEQANNKRYNHLLTFNGKTQTIAQWSEELNIKRSTLSQRLRYGWNIERALSY